MFKLSFHSNGKFQSLEISWNFVVAFIAIIGSFITGLITTIFKGILILAIAIQGLFADPVSFKSI